MKKSLFSLAILLAIFITSCEGDQGPPGPEGPPGLLGQVVEFTADLGYDPGTNSYSVFFDFPGSVEVFESDAVLVYRLEEVVNVGGLPTDVWSLLPQNFFFNDGGIIQYVYNHTFVDVGVFIEGNFNLVGLNTAFTQDQVFRVAIVPTEFASTQPNMEQLLSFLKMDDSVITR